MLKQLNFAASLTCLVLGLLVAPLSAPIFGNVAHAQQVQKMQIEQLRTQARAAFRNNNPEQALRLSEQLLIANPRDLQARFLRATILVSLGRGAQIRNEVELMARLNLSPKDKNRAQALLAAIDKQNKIWLWRLISALAMGKRIMLIHGRKLANILLQMASPATCLTQPIMKKPNWMTVFIM